jgi:hypothetical protein
MEQDDSDATHAFNLALPDRDGNAVADRLHE